jgi:uncharacterized RDD family membrane protein YckC
VILHEVLTTEKVPFTYRVAGLGARFLAWLLDALFVALLYLAGACFVSLVPSRYGDRPGLAGALVAVWLFCLMWGYFLFFEWLWSGQTPGKRLLGLRVIQWRGTAISFYQSAARNLLRVVDSLPFFYALGFLVAWTNRENRRLGDLAAGTLVVHVERQARPIQALTAAATEADRARRALVRQRLAQLTRDQKGTLIDLALRRDQLWPEERARLFRAVVTHLRQRLDLAPQEFESDEKFVLELAAILTERVQ